MDLYCQMCAEPYEDYHVRHDMPEDERRISSTARDVMCVGDKSLKEAGPN